MKKTLIKYITVIQILSFIITLSFLIAGLFFVSKEIALIPFFIQLSFIQIPCVLLKEILEPTIHKYK
jgi:hypothetical protein